MKRDKMTKVREKQEMDSYLAVWCFGELLNPEMTAAIPCKNNTTTHRALTKIADSFYKKRKSFRCNPLYSFHNYGVMHL